MHLRGHPGRGAARPSSRPTSAPKDIQLAEVHDNFTITEILAIEDLGFFPKGKGGKAVADGLTRFGGQIAVNTSGGLKARGDPIGATGVAQIVELVQQLRGQAGKRQVQRRQVRAGTERGRDRRHRRRAHPGGGLMTTARFWRENATRYNLMATRCGFCGKVTFPPRHVCPICHRKSIGKMEQFKLNGKGEVYSFSVVHEAPPRSSCRSPTSWP